MTDARRQVINKWHLAGILKSRETTEAAQSAYLMAPKICPHCQRCLPYDKRKLTYCGHSCAASVTNIGTRRYGKSMEEKCHPCRNCSGDTFRDGPFCSTTCAYGYKWKIQLEHIRTTGEILGNSESSCISWARRYLKDTAGCKCAICATESWMGKPMPLILDHVNGNSSDWKLSNLRLVCGNCDMQLPTYKGRNKGNGREWRKIQEAKKLANIKRVAEGEQSQYCTKFGSLISSGR